MNNASFSRRFISFIIDFIFISSILMILAYFIPKNSNFDFINSDMNTLTEQALSDELTFKGYLREFAVSLSDLEKMNTIYNSLSFIILVVYYVIIPIFTNATLGKYIMRLRIKRQDGKKLNILNTFMRSTIDVGMLISLLTIFLVQIVNGKIFLITLIIFTFIQFLLVIITVFMILYRSDRRGLDDILSRSNIEVKR